MVEVSVSLVDSTKVAAFKCVGCDTVVSADTSGSYDDLMASLAAFKLEHQHN